MGKVAKDGSPVPLDRDARPIVMGQVFRKLVGKCLYRMELSGMRQRLLPTQLGIGLSNGAELLVHAYREWIGHNRDREDIVLLQKDIKNAFNELLPVVCAGFGQIRGMELWCQLALDIPGSFGEQLKRPTRMPLNDGIVLSHA
eukprot:s292_g7.t1